MMKPTVSVHGPPAIRGKCKGWWTLAPAATPEKRFG